MMEDGKEPVYASKAKPWLKYYDEKYIHQSVPECSAFALVCRNNERHLGDTALEYYGRKFSYADLIVQIKKTAAALQALGVKKGDIITVVSVMTPEVVYTFYAADLLGATLNLVDPRYSAEGIHECSGDSGSAGAHSRRQNIPAVSFAPTTSCCAAPPRPSNGQRKSEPIGFPQFFYTIFTLCFLTFAWGSTTIALASIVHFLTKDRVLWGASCV